jgi:hypothetical protein
MAIFCVITLVPVKVFGGLDASYASRILSGVIGVAFTLIFVDLNIKAKNPSFIMYVLTWLSLMAGLWVSG